MIAILKLVINFKYLAFKSQKENDLKLPIFWLDSFNKTKNCRSVNINEINIKKIVGCVGLSKINYQHTWINLKKYNLVLISLFVVVVWQF